MARKSTKVSVQASSGNVFADLKVTNAGEKQTKVRLAVELNQVLKNERISQTAAARRLKVSQPKISALMNYRLDGFSVERLMNFLNALGRDVEIVIRKRPNSRKPGKVHVSAA